MRLMEDGLDHLAVSGLLLDFSLLNEAIWQTCSVVCYMEIKMMEERIETESYSISQLLAVQFYFIGCNMQCSTPARDNMEYDQGIFLVYIII